VTRRQEAPAAGGGCMRERAAEEGCQRKWGATPARRNKGCTVLNLTTRGISSPFIKVVRNGICSIR
jgi:hypothetical protein